MPELCPIELPAGWTAEPDSRGVIVTGYDGTGCRGYVTVDIQRRGFALGMSSVHRGDVAKYAGRGWQVALFTDAVRALQAALAPTGAAA